MKPDALKLGKTKSGNVNGVVRSSNLRNAHKNVALIHVPWPIRVSLVTVVNVKTLTKNKGVYHGKHTA
jgi:hypothetical protein